MIDILQSIARKSSDFIEIRHHRRLTRGFMAQKGRLDLNRSSVSEGLGVRVKVNGCWGFASTDSQRESDWLKAVEQARAAAHFLAKRQQVQSPHSEHRLPEGYLAKGYFADPGFALLTQMSAEAKINAVLDYENRLKHQHNKIIHSQARYNEILEEKTIVTSDGAAATYQLALPEFNLSAIAEDGGERASYASGAGIRGSWECLFQHPTLNRAVEETAKHAVDLTTADYASGGQKVVILAPALVGLLCHEAIGHTVEADFVKSGSVAAGKLGQRVGSDLVNLVDSGQDFTGQNYAVGTIPFDDEGVLTKTTPLITRGILTSYLHNRESASEFGVEPTGNARAWSFQDEPLIRMRNTYMLPGDSKLQDMIASTKSGYLVEGAGGGQADSNGEFMFGASYMWEIKNGKKGRRLREASLSGVAFDVLQTVDAVSDDFRWDLGTGYCGKGQPAKVDAGGPYIRCKMHVGGR